MSRPRRKRGDGDELLDVIEAKGREVAEALAALRAMGRPDFGVTNRSG